MRYYDIKIYKAGSQPSPANLIKEYTSFPLIGGRNQNDPGALNVVLDIYTGNSAAAVQSAVVQIWGISLQDIAQANNFTGCPIEVYAGFQAGLPLNNPSQAGLILLGQIFQSFGNWQNTDMTLDFVITTDGALAAQNSNIVLNWQAGTQLATALKSTLTVAFPSAKLDINISPSLVANHNQVGVYQSLPAFNQNLKAVTAAILGGTYAGVDVITLPGVIAVFDGTATPTAPAQIAFQDLIGQPTWIDNLTIQFVCPMRADISVTDYVTLPQGLLGNANNGFGAPGAVTTTAASYPQARQQSVFKGTFLVTQVHHMGSFRQADGQSWVTVFNAVAQVSS